jgi:hypothetical protein
MLPVPQRRLLRVASVSGELAGNVEFGAQHAVAIYTRIAICPQVSVLTY